MLSPKKPNTVEAVYYFIREYLHKDFTPHEGQVPIGHAIFEKKCKVIFVRCGRNFGKSRFASYAVSRYALENPDSRVYYFAPLYKQVKDIVWHPKLVHDFIAPDAISRIDNQDTRFHLHNGSYIKLDGSDNFDSQRGYKPDLVVADEFAEFDERWLEVMIPNLAARDATILFLGTPPRNPVLHNGRKHHYVMMDEECRKRAKVDPSRTFWIHRPTTVNPFISEEWLDIERNRLLSRDEEYVWEREYEARIVFGDKRRIFPDFSLDKHRIDHEKLMEIIGERPDTFEYYVGADPGTKSVFATVFIAIDRYTGTLYWLDEIYEENPSYTTTGNMCKRIKEKMYELAPTEEWGLVADSAAAWFIEEANLEYDMAFSPSLKQRGDKDEGISTLKTLFIDKEQIMSDRCERCTNEFLNYMTNERGMAIKMHDHTIDATRYIVKFAQFTFIPEDIPVKVEEDPIKEGLMVSIEQDMKRVMKENDWLFGIEEMYR